LDSLIQVTFPTHEISPRRERNEITRWNGVLCGDKKIRLANREIKKMIKSAAIQMVSGIDVEENLRNAEQLVAEASKKGARLVVLPENFALMGETEFSKLDFAEDEDHRPIQDKLSDMARKNAVWIVAGTLPMKASVEGKIRASCWVYNDQGESIVRYDKIHLFDVNVPGTDESYQESDTIEAGQDSLLIDTPFGKLGIAICYDLRFPELFRQLLDKGMEMLAVPSAFTAETGADHWELLVRARAVENQCYVIAANQGGKHQNGRETYGDSMIVDPWGNILSRLAKGSGVVCADIDLERMNKIRGFFPAVDHRKMACSIKL